MNAPQNEHDAPLTRIAGIAARAVAKAQHEILLSNERIIEIRKAQQGRYGSAGLAPYADSIQFARAIESAVADSAISRIRELEGALENMTAQRDAWREVAEDQYGKLRASLYGEESYPTLGALDAWAAGRHPCITSRYSEALEGEKL